MTTPLKRLALAATAALALSACASDKVWMRSGSRSTDAEIDEMSCTEQSESSGVSVSVGGDPSPPMDRFSQRSACLRSRGYKLVTLDADESARLKSLSGASREAYWAELLAKRGYSAPAQEPAPSGPALSPPPAARPQ